MLKPGFIAVLASVAYFPVVGCSSSTSSGVVNTSKFGTAAELQSALSKIANGEKQINVEAIIGTGHVEGEESIAARITENNPQYYPQGVRKEDQFILYRIGEDSIYLQFRDGVLVNHRPEDYGAKHKQQMKSLHSTSSALGRKD